MAKKNSQKEKVENRQSIITTCIACVVLLCVVVTGVIIVAGKAQHEANKRVAWQGAYARYFGGDGENALQILTRDYQVGLNELHDFGTVVSIIEGTEAASGFEWAIWLNGERITDRPADQIDTKNGDVIYWNIVRISDN
ncbi:hypothetical protein FWG86_00340 [Candidatus Saccharibacteria bacterium]|nr:hypothetical protein [Candidatus Saccharibacteria bacterium]